RVRPAASASGPRRIRSSLPGTPHSWNRIATPSPSAAAAAPRSISRGGVARPRGSLRPGRLPVSERRAVEFAPKDAQLRDDVRTLGALVGDVIREQCGEAFFPLVERSRHAAIAGAADELQGLVKGLPPRDAET